MLTSKARTGITKNQSYEFPGKRTLCKVWLSLRWGRGWPSEDAAQFPLGLQAQLAASRINVVPFFAAQRGGDLVFFQCLQKSFLGSFTGAFPRQPLNLIVRNQVHLGMKVADKSCQRHDLVESIIHSGDQDVFQRDDPPLLFLII